MRSIDIFNGAINMSGLMIKNDDDDKWLSNSNLLYNTVNYGDLTNKNIGRKQRFWLKESGQGNNR